MLRKQKFDVEELGNILFRDVKPITQLNHGREPRQQL